MRNLIAQAIDSIPLGPEEGFSGPGRLGLEGVAAEDAPKLLNELISTAIGVMTFIAFVWFVLLFIMGAIGIITSGGDQKKLAGAKGQLTTGIIGLVVVIAAVFIIDLIGAILGVENILNPASIIYNLSGGGP